jgi:hypothetical protein
MRKEKPVLFHYSDQRNSGALRLLNHESTADHVHCLDHKSPRDYIECANRNQRLVRSICCAAPSIDANATVDSQHRKWENRQAARRWWLLQQSAEALVIVVVIRKMERT